MNCRNVVKDEDILQWEGLVFKICNKYCTFPSEDMLQVARIGLWKGLCTYNYEDPAANLMTYLTRTITNEVFQYFRIESKHSRLETVSLQHVLNRDEHGNELTLADKMEHSHDYISIVEYVECFETIWNNTCLRDREIFRMWYDGETQRQIAKHFGLSQSYLCRIIQKIQNDFKGGSR